MPLKTHILRLGSVVPNGVGGPQAGAIDLIYAFLLQEYCQDAYSYIHVNQIGEDLDELIIKEGKSIYINIRYPAYEDFKQWHNEKQNLMRLDIVHTALLRIAEYDNKLDKLQLENIRKHILANNFSFDLVYRIFVNKKNPNLSAKVIIHPQILKFSILVQIEHDGKVLCKLPIYHGKTTNGYFKLFSKGKWKGNKEFNLFNNEKEVEFRILVDECKVEVINLSQYDNPPYFQMMKAELSEEESTKAYSDYLHSLPPSIAWAISNVDN